MKRMLPLSAGFTRVLYTYAIIISPNEKSSESLNNLVVTATRIIRVAIGQTIVEARTECRKCKAD